MQMRFMFVLCHMDMGNYYTEKRTRTCILKYIDNLHCNLCLVNTSDDRHAK